MSAHVPVGEVKRWRERAEAYEREYHSALRYQHEITAAVGQMHQAASQRGGDVSELQKEKEELLREQKRRDSEFKNLELEKQEMQNVQRTTVTNSTTNEAAAQAEARLAALQKK